MSEAANPYFEQFAVEVNEPSQVGDARRQLARILQRNGLSDNVQSNAAIVVNELATNLIRHTSGGEILFRLTHSDKTQFLDFWSIDRGPGISDLAKAQEDGYSTKGGAGTGLGALRRLSQEFDLFSIPAAASSPNAGTVIYSRLLGGVSPRNAASHFRFAGLSKPAPYEVECGDAWFAISEGDKLSLYMADGLGHGPLASHASEEGLLEFTANPFNTLDLMVSKMHQRLRTTRGAAVALLHMDGRGRTLSYLSVGNIAGIFKPLGETRAKGLMANNGSIGLEYRKPISVTLPLEEDAVVILHSDGLQTRWRLEDYPGLQARSPGLIAGVLFRDFTRLRDDATIAVVRYSRKPHTSG